MVSIFRFSVHVLPLCVCVCMRGGVGWGYMPCIHLTTCGYDKTNTCLIKWQPFWKFFPFADRHETKRSMNVVTGSGLHRVSMIKVLEYALHVFLFSLSFKLLLICKFSFLPVDPWDIEMKTGVYVCWFFFSRHIPGDWTTDLTAHTSC